MAPLPRAWTIALAVALTACGSPAIPTPVALPEPTTPSAREPPTEIDGDYARAISQEAFGKDALRAALEAYVRTHPYAKQAGEALTTLGDLEFDEVPRRLELAKGYYRSSVAHEWNPEKRAYALLMLARAARLLGDIEEARPVIEQAIEAARYSAKPNPHSLQYDALEEAAVLFADYGAPAEAYDYFRKLSRNSEETSLWMLSRLAQVYEEAGKYPEAMAIYDALRFHDPKNACRWTVWYRHASPRADPAKLEGDLAKCPQ